MQNKNEKTVLLTELGKLPPQALDLEEAVLGAIMLEKEAFIRVQNMLNVGSFYKDEHQKIYTAILELVKENSGIDILTVRTKLKDLGYLESVGGAYYVTQLTNRVASSAHIEYHATIIQQKYIQREVIRCSSELQMLAYEENENIILKSNEFNTYFNALVQGKTNEIKIADALFGSIKNAEIRNDNFKKGIKNGIPSGLNSLDYFTNGFQNGDLIVIGARPAMGKTAILLKFAKSIGKANKYVRIYQLEMSAIRLADRILISESGVDATRYKKGDLQNYDWNEIESAYQRLSQLPIIIDDKANKTISEIHSSCMIAKNKNQCDIVMIDYLQLINSSKEKGKNREQEVAEISRACKLMAKDLNCPVILLAQLNRDVEKRGNKRPTLSDLRESGSLEQDADIVMFIYRDAVYGNEVDASGNSTKNIGELIIGKNREGDCGTAKFWYNDSLTVITDIDKHNNDEVDLLDGIEVEMRIKSNYDHEQEGNFIESKYNSFDNNPF